MARAAPPTPATAPAPAAPAPVDTTPDAPDDATPVDPIAQLHDMEARIEQLRSVVVGRQPRVTVGGYIDFGFFVPEGDGTGVARDVGNMLFPQYAGQYGWVFYGDLLAPAVNSRGEVADLGQLPGVTRFDSVHSQGAPGFIVNEVNLTLTSGLGESAVATASVNFMPRSGSNFSLGDFLDVDLAQLEWMPTASQRTSIFVGKFDSVLGIEYRERKAAQRFGITPSLIARYTTGTALGLKVRHKMGPDDLFVVAAAVTNGSFTTEQFHFYDEIDTNVGKTISGRLSLHPPTPFELELGASGSWGSQDRARSSDGVMWFYGADLQLRVSTVDVKAAWLRGKAPGDPLDEVYGLNLHGGGYCEVDWMITPLFGVLGRGEYRDALVWLLGDPAGNRLYVTKSWRGTAGVRFAITDRIIVKAEYLDNGEYGGLPQVKNNVFTSSLLLIN
ncbi:MAG TPA: hypothetical protein VHJ20_06140 [Polyangia bacterium]|nr:hypothetical protein [Polyangia bacterium]